MSYLDTFARINAVEIECMEAQELIDVARATFAHDQYLQLQLDRKQSELNDKRELIDVLRTNIAIQN